MRTLNHETSMVIQDIVKITTHKVLIDTGKLPAFISLNNAYKQYGEGVVDRWIKEGLVKPIKDGDKNCKVRIDRVQIESVAHTSNRASWYENHCKD